MDWPSLGGSLVVLLVLQSVSENIFCNKNAIWSIVFLKSVSSTGRITICSALFPKFESSLSVGGAVGGLLGCWWTSGEFRPLPQVLMELSPQQQKKLYDELMAIIGDLQWTDVIQLTLLVMSNGTLKQQVTGALLGYVTKELQAEVKYVD